MKSSKPDLQGIYKLAKRIGITVLVCIPFLIAFAYLTRKVITSNALQIFCFVVIMLVAVLIEDLVVRSREKKKKNEPIVEDKTDVFK